MTDYDDSSVRVAVRIRPQLARERIDMCQVCTSVPPGEPQVLIGNDNKAFTFDFVFDILAHQDVVYDACCKQLVEGCFEGYNATIFAYGQTGSGKTYTMGTGFDTTIQTDEVGIIPRAVQHFFNSVEERRKVAFENGDTLPDFRITAQFLELYNEEIVDLLDTTRDPSDKFKKSHIKIHEDAQGGIYIANITSRPVASYQDTIKCLEIGALSRSTASTNMNAQSSRSHAVFTLLIKQQRVVHEKFMLEDGKDRDTSEPDTVSEFETLTAKFHFVDLAGSERLKRTGATGDRAKEGISINCGLLALGNVISALGDKLKRGSHVPYRDSKLTRLLQDSLGGNSRTVMIACISPSDRDFMETLNTLKYANRARNIKNKVVANQDKTSRQIASLKAQVQELQEELMAYRSGRPLPDSMSTSYEMNSDMATENSMLLAENNNLRQRVKALRETVDSQAARLAQFVADRDMQIIANSAGDDSQNAVRMMIEGYGKQIEELRAKLYEAEMSADMAYRQSARISAARSPMVNTLPSAISDTSLTPDFHLHDIIVEAKRDLKRQKKIQRVQSSRSRTASIGDVDAEPQDETPSRPESARVSANFDDENLNESSNFNEEGGEEETGSNSDTEENENLREHLAELTCDINIKEKLIEELELSQRRLQTMKVQYEEKMTALNTKIRETETERDRVLSSLSNMSGQQESLSEEKTRKIREDYERKLSEMRSEMQKLQAARKEHQQLLKNQSHHEKQITTLQRELGDMKKEKVKLVQMVQENSQKTRQSEARHSQEIARLKKEQRAKDNQIKALEADKKSKEMVLKRKQEEVALLRKQQKPLSTAAAGRVGKYDKAPTVPALPFTTSLQRRDMRTKPVIFSPKMSKARWELVEKSLNSVIVKKQTLSNMERDMDRWIRQRESWRKKIEKTSRKLEKSGENRDEQARRQLQDELEVQRANMKLVQDNISDCQSTIVGLEEAKDDEFDPLNLARQCRSLDEALYMFEHFIQLVVNKGTELAQKDADVKELEAKLHHERMDGTFQREMLQYLIQDKVDIDIDRSLLSPGVDDDEEDDDDDSDGVSAPTSRSPSPIDNRMLLDSQALQSTCIVPPASEIVANRAVQGSMESVASKTGGKARRRTALPEDLLYGSGPPAAPASSAPSAALPTIGSSPITAEQMAEVTAESRNVIQQLEKLVEDTKKLDTSAILAKKADSAASTPLSGSTNLFSSPSITLVPPPKNGPLARPKLTVKMPDSAPEVTKLLTPEVSPMLSNKNIAKDSTSSSGSWRRGNSVTSVNSSTSSLSHQGSTSEISPPSSPSAKYRLENVFSRLTSVSGQPTSPHPTRGVINPVTARTYRTGPLVHAHTAVGHAKAVLSVFATNDLMFTSSKDRTAKVWDLTTGEEFVTLDDHPNNVTAVRYSEDTGLVYTVSAYFVKVWDIRQGRKCVKTLLSSGLLNEGSMAVSVNSRKVVCPPGETNINDIQLNSPGTVLYTAAGSSVRLWDIRTFKAMGKLSGSHQSPVMVMAVDDTDTADGNTCIVTGSKDHYIKVFEVMEDSVGVLSPKHSLLPPHYDGIQSLCLMGDLLFSGSRDMCIKKWDLSDCTLKQSINNAHKDWVCGLALLPGGNCLLSGCRGGMVKLWHIDSCAPIGEMKAHESPINAVTTNESLVFTASDDRTVRVWQERNGTDSADGGGTSPSAAAAARLD